MVEETEFFQSPVLEQNEHLGFFEEATELAECGPNRKQLYFPQESKVPFTFNALIIPWWFLLFWNHFLAYITRAINHVGLPLQIPREHSSCGYFECFNVMTLMMLWITRVIFTVNSPKQLTPQESLYTQWEAC